MDDIEMSDTIAEQHAFFRLNAIDCYGIVRMVREKNTEVFIELIH